ncbi:zinc transporter ZIP2 isoform X3 [Petaurus breviceps papuanus]|uniref:zinc transporter ZIP2 isoform X3 n=1 Tax=Petaurus breviceps papuanus TaxID=3040969 RepID=UPI0036DE8AF0
MEPLVGVKIGCLLALLTLTLFCGIIPICFKWFRIHAATGKHRRVLSLLGCVSAGVFLGAGLMHMTAEALESIDSEIERYILQNRTGNEGNSSDTTDSTHNFSMQFEEPENSPRERRKNGIRNPSLDSFGL